MKKKVWQQNHINYNGRYTATSELQMGFHAPVTFKKKGINLIRGEILLDEAKFKHDKSGSNSIKLVVGF